MRTIIQLSRNRLLQHIAFWLLYLWPCVYALIDMHGATGLIPAAGIVLITLPVCYFNLYFLIPRYLLKDKGLIYAGLLIGLDFVYALLWTFLYLFCLIYIFHSKREVHFFPMYFDNLLEQSVTIAITTALKLSKDWYRQNQRAKALETQNLHAELRLLKAQINPHFLFNTLNNLYALTLKKSDLAPETVLKLSNIMEYMIYESNETTVPLEKEIKYLKDYIDLERLRQSEKTTIRFEVDGHVNGQRIAPLLLLPFVENTFKHGANKIADKARVDIHIQVDNKHLQLIAENNKPALAQNGHAHNGFGISNVVNRLKLVYPDRHQLDISDEPSSYTVHLNLDLS